MSGTRLVAHRRPANKHGDFDAMLDGLSGCCPGETLRGPRPLHVRGGVCVGVTYFDETENEVFKEYMA